MSTEISISRGLAHRLFLLCALLPGSLGSAFGSAFPERGNLPKLAGTEKKMFKNVILDESIKTVLLHTSDSELEHPVILLGDSKRLVLQFDDLSDKVRSFSYTFEHCTFDWQSSNLPDMEYMQGYYQSTINDYSYSFNTLVDYTHYALEFPNNDIQLTRSGNYVIRVYADNDPEQVVLVQRFMIYENNSTISATVKPSSIVSERDRRQEVDIAVNIFGLNSYNPYAEVELKVMQNFRWDNVRSGLKPSFVNGQKLVYDFQGELTFNGGNEYRYFDIKSLSYRTEQVANITFQDDLYQAYLAPDLPRAFKVYTFDQDLNGRFLIKNDDMDESHLESDYLKVHFFLRTPNIGTDRLYVFGGLSGGTFREDMRLSYDENKGGYSAEIYLKQGYYNYVYMLRTASGRGDITMIEGNHYDTENNYTILVYFHDPQTFADRLIGVSTVNSLNN